MPNLPASSSRSAVMPNAPNRIYLPQLPSFLRSVIILASSLGFLSAISFCALACSRCCVITSAARLRARSRITSGTFSSVPIFIKAAGSFCSSAYLLIAAV